MCRVQIQFEKINFFEKSLFFVKFSNFFALVSQQKKVFFLFFKILIFFEKWLQWEQ